MQILLKYYIKLDLYYKSNYILIYIKVSLKVKEVILYL